MSSQIEVTGRNSSCSMWCCSVGHVEVLELMSYWKSVMFACLHSLFESA